VNSSDNIYVANHGTSHILVWSKESIGPVRNLTVRLYGHTSLFVTINGNIYFENGNADGQIDKWTKGATSSVIVTKFTQHCHGLFIDTNDNLYCTFRFAHRVMKFSVDSSTTDATVVAGTGGEGSGSNELHSPWGIFVDTSFNLYVADSENDRIQLFRPGQLKGKTVAGNGVPNNLDLKFPTDVVLDANDYLYIADNQNNRIIRSNRDGYQCIAGCSRTSGSASNELDRAYAIRFDSFGNLYVADEFNDRVQKFYLKTNSCGKYNEKN
jgi:sugar lactone lactonase YvrE